MSRPLRIEYEGAFYHVMNRGRGRQPVFHGKKYYEAFLQCLDQASHRFEVEVHAYCLMGNHYHLLLRTPKANLGRAMRHVNGVYTQYHNQMKRSDGPLFRGRYKAMNIEASSYLLEVSRYIHRNPVETKKPMVKALVDYAWSSYPAYRNKVETPDWLVKDAVFAELGSGQPTASYARFVERPVDEELSTLYAKGQWPAVLGTKAFAESAYLNALNMSCEVRTARGSIEFTDVIQAVAAHFDCKSDDVMYSKRGTRNVKRWLAMRLAQEKTDETLEQLAARFGVGSYSTVSQTIGRLSRLMIEDTAVRLQYIRISQVLTP